MSRTTKRIIGLAVFLAVLAAGVGLVVVPTKGRDSGAGPGGHAAMLAATESPPRAALPEAQSSEPTSTAAPPHRARVDVMPAAAGPAARPARPAAPRTRTLCMTVTAYCPCPKCCGRYSDGKTASGRSIYTNGSQFVAADTRLLPFGTRVSIPGYAGGRPVPVLDRGGKIKGRRLDVFFLFHARAKKWGRRTLDVVIYLD